MKEGIRNINLKAAALWKGRGRRLLFAVLLLTFSSCSFFSGPEGRFEEKYLGELLWTLYGDVSSPYGRRGWFGHHDGIDIRAPNGTKVHASHSGTVVFAGVQNGYGRIVKLDDGEGLQTWYAHHSKILVRKGQRVKRGDVIALVGSSGNATGPHLHFEIHRRDDERLATINPLTFFPGEVG